mgnify:CR=1 FL=1
MLENRAEQKKQRQELAKPQAQAKVTGNAARAPVASEYLVDEAERGQSTTALMIALLLAAVTGAIMLVNIKRLPKNHIVVKLHKDGRHSELVIRLNREHHGKKQ